MAKNVSYLAICINIIKRIFFGGEGGRRRLSPLKTGNFSRSSLGVNQKRINFNSRVCGKGTIMCRILHFPALDSRLIFTFEKIGEFRGRMTALLRMARLRMGIQNGVENCKPLVSFFLLPLNREVNKKLRGANGSVYRLKWKVKQIVLDFDYKLW